MKIVAVNIAFRDELFYKRWRELANKYDVDITLVGPKKYTYRKFGNPITFRPHDIDEGDFRVKHINMKPINWLRGDWLSLEYLSILLNSKPDIIYLIGYEAKNVVLLSQMYRLLFNQQVKIGLFTMRGIDLPLHGVEFRFRWKLSRKIFDFVNVHYPHGKEIIMNQGNYKGPIQIQTQIGVDKDIFYPDGQQRREIRAKYGIDEKSTVFSSAIRIEDEKGVFDIIEACKTIRNLDFKYLLLGDGVDYNKVKDNIDDLHLSDKIILTGKIDPGTDVAAHLNGSDCFVHVPKTTPNWVDTFPLAVVQAMSTALPIIGSNSGAIPYQLGENGFIVPEQNPKSLAEMMQFVISNREVAQEKGKMLQQRVLKSFEIQHLNKCLYQSFQGILDGDEDKLIQDQVNAFI